MKEEIENALKTWNFNISFEEICAYWDVEGRYYHTSKHHLEDTLNLINESRFLYKLSEYDFDLLILSALFHDIIYTPGAEDNEERSVELMKTFNKSELNSSSISRMLTDLSKIILETKNHIGSTKMSKLFQNLDMSILNSDFRTLLKYETLIRKEYIFVDSLDYLNERSKFLLDNVHLVDNPENIYHLIKYLEFITYDFSDL